MGSGGADEAARQVCISIDSPIDEANASPGPSRPATPVLLALPTTSESAPTEPSEGERLTSGTQLSSQLLLDEHTLMYLPPLTRLLLDSFRKDMTNRGVDAFLRRNGAPALPDGLSPPAAKASLRHWGSCGRRASASEPGGWPAHISLSALRKIPASCGVAMSSSSKPASLLLQLDAIERVLGRRAAPAAEAGGDGDAPGAGASAEGGGGAAAKGGAVAAPGDECTDETLEQLEVSVLAEAAERLTHVAERARAALGSSLERMASSGSLHALSPRAAGLAT